MHNPSYPGTFSWQNLRTMYLHGPPAPLGLGLDHLQLPGRSQVQHHEPHAVSGSLSLPGGCGRPKGPSASGQLLSPPSLSSAAGRLEPDGQELSRPGTRSLPSKK